MVVDVGVVALEAAAGAVDRHADSLRVKAENRWERKLADAVGDVATELRAMAEMCEKAHPEGSPACTE